MGGLFAAIRRGQIAVSVCSIWPNLSSCRPIKGAVSAPRKLPSSPTQSDPENTVNDFEQYRLGFEACATTQNWIVDRDSFGDYRYSTARDGWEAWKAAKFESGLSRG